MPFRKKQLRLKCLTMTLRLCFRFFHMRGAWFCAFSHNTLFVFSLNKDFIHKDDARPVWTYPSIHNGLVLCNKCYNTACIEATEERSSDNAVEEERSNRRRNPRVKSNSIISNFKTDDYLWWLEEAHKERARQSGYPKGCLCCLKAFPPVKT